MTEISDKEACLIAKKYVWQEYFRDAGQTVYIWEEGSDEDLGGAESCSGFAPPDDKFYKTFLIDGVKTTGAKVVSREELDGEPQIQVTVYCTTSQSEGSRDDELSQEEFYQEEREIYCYLEPDEQGSWYVAEAEE